MEVKVEELAPCKRKLEWVIPREDVVKELGEKAADLRTTVFIPGFRIGRAPLRLVEKRFGSQIQDDVKQSLLSSSCTKAFEEHGLKPLGEPEIEAGEIDAEEGFKVQVTVNVKPTFDVVDYAALTVKKPKDEATEEAVDRVIENMRESKAVLKPIGEEGIGAHDEIAADLEITAEGIEPIRESDIDISLADPALDGLEFTNLGEQIAGAKVNESREVDAKATDEFEVEEHRGKPVRVKLTILDAKRKTLPELDDEFAKTYRMETLDELRGNVRSRVAASMAQRSQQALRTNLETALLDQYTFELPQDIVDVMAESMVLRERQRLESQGVSSGEIGGHIEAMRTAGEDSATRQMKLVFILEALADKEKVFVTDAEVDERIEMMARVYGVPTARLKREMEDANSISSTRNQMRDDKVIEFLLGKVQIEEEAAEDKTQEEQE